jgi:hypothetical protein
MSILREAPPPNQVRNSQFPGRQYWRPGDPLPKDRQPDALEALDRNARAAEEAFKLEQSAARRMRWAA